MIMKRVPVVIDAHQKQWLKAVSLEPAAQGLSSICCSPETCGKITLSVGSKAKECRRGLSEHAVRLQPQKD